MKGENWAQLFICRCPRNIGLLHPIAPTFTRQWYIFTVLPYQIHDIARYENHVIEICNVYTDLFSASSVKRIHIVYVYHVLVAYHLTGVQMGTFIGKNP